MDPRAEFPEFYDNPHIAVLATTEGWTVSTQEATERFPNKAPLDMRCLLDGGTSRSGDRLPPGTIRGAFKTDRTCLVTLDELTARLPRASNCAYYLRTFFDGYLVVDIEKTCPPEEAARLLAMPGALYSETSMSGKGYHLLMPRPANFHDYGPATRKRVLRHPQGWWEILLEHWVTFTRRQIPADVRERMQALAPEAPPTWEELWAEIADGAKDAAKADLEVDAEKPEIPFEEEIIALVTKRPHGKTKAEFHNDTSRFEFSALGVLWHRMGPAVGYYAYKAPKGTYTDSVLVWLLYACAVKVLPHRAKHDTERGGMPYLWDRAANLVAARRGEPDE